MVAVAIVAAKGGEGGRSGGRGQAKSAHIRRAVLPPTTSPKTLVWELASLALGLEQVAYASVVGEFLVNENEDRRQDEM